MWNNLLCKLWNLMLSHQVKWNKSLMRRSAFHIAKQYFTCEAYFTNPVRDLFRWKRPMLCIKASVFFWQRMRDSNPRKRSQSPVCYRYTNPLCVKHGYYYIERSENVKHFLINYREFFSSVHVSLSGCAFIIPGSLATAVYWDTTSGKTATFGCRKATFWDSARGAGVANDFR